MILDRAPKGRNETTIMDFVRRQDEYEERATPRGCCAWRSPNGGRAAVAPRLIAPADLAIPNFRAPRPSASVHANRRINGEGKREGRR